MQHTHAHTRACPNCGGFAVATITTGTRLPDGSRKTTSVPCRTCNGTGAAPSSTADATPLGSSSGVA